MIQNQICLIFFSQPSSNDTLLVPTDTNLPNSVLQLPLHSTLPDILQSTTKLSEPQSFSNSPTYIEFSSFDNSTSNHKSSLNSTNDVSKNNLLTTNHQLYFPELKDDFHSSEGGVSKHDRNGNDKTRKFLYPEEADILMTSFDALKLPSQQFTFLDEKKIKFSENLNNEILDEIKIDTMDRRQKNDSPRLNVFKRASICLKKNIDRIFKTNMIENNKYSNERLDKTYKQGNYRNNVINSLNNSMSKSPLQFNGEYLKKCNETVLKVNYVKKFICNKASFKKFFCFTTGKNERLVQLKKLCLEKEMEDSLFQVSSEDVAKYNQVNVCFYNYNLDIKFFNIFTKFPNKIKKLLKFQKFC